MKTLLWFAVLVFICSCSSGDSNDQSKTDDSISHLVDSLNNSMCCSADSTRIPDSIAAARWLDSIANDSINAAELTFPTSFKVQYTSSYCGGARPTDEILAEKQKLRPLSSSSLKFKNHFTGKEYLVKTNAEAIGEVQMEEGKYDVFLTKDINSNLGTGFDPKCKIWQDQLLLTVKVNSSGKIQDINIHFTCNPCDESVKRQ